MVGEGCCLCIGGACFVVLERKENDVMIDVLGYGVYIKKRVQ